MAAADEIARKSKSNLAFALRVIPKYRRAAMLRFYAFCRLVDDIADDPHLPTKEKFLALDHWRSVISGALPPENEHQRDAAALFAELGIPAVLPLQIIDGCRSDIDFQSFPDWAALDSYIRKVSVAVGLVSVKLFGCTSPDAERYAAALGRALQLTNILRDVREDWENGRRSYFPADELARYGISPADIADGSEIARPFLEFQSRRAKEFFYEAETLLPAGDRRALLPARIMAGIYRKILHMMEKDGFRMHRKRYRLPRAAMLGILLRELIVPSAVAPSVPLE